MFPGRFSGTGVCATTFARRSPLRIRSGETEAIIAELGGAIFSLCIVS